jgi:alpha-methylacyl-CoA racemase
MLSGVRIVELEALGPAPFASMLLADLGADVITVHRKAGPPTLETAQGKLLDRGKRSIALDLKAPADTAILRRLLPTVDGLIEGFRPGVMERLGLSPEVCHKLCPKLVYGRMTGWGQTGPKAAQAGHDLNYIGLSGAALVRLCSKRCTHHPANAGKRYRWRYHVFGDGDAGWVSKGAQHRGWMRGRCGDD